MQETAGGGVLLMEQNSAFHKRTAEVDGLFRKWLMGEEPVVPCGVLGNTVWALQIEDHSSHLCM